ncbi:MAG: hypothetical protein QM650_06565 [Microlunatus sp.]
MRNLYMKNFNPARHFRMPESNPGVYYFYRNLPLGSAQTRIRLEKFDEDYNMVLAQRALYESWNVNDRDALNSRIAHTLLNAYKSPAILALQESGLQFFLDTTHERKFSRSFH